MRFGLTSNQIVAQPLTTLGNILVFESNKSMLTSNPVHEYRRYNLIYIHIENMKRKKSL